LAALLEAICDKVQKLVDRHPRGSGFVGVGVSKRLCPQAASGVFSSESGVLESFPHLIIIFGCKGEILSPFFGGLAAKPRPRRA
jgi:hypothetical protein